MHVALVGPCSPVDVVDLLDGQDAVKAMHVLGYRGIPVSELAKGLISAGARVTVVSTDSTISAHNVEFSSPRFRMVVQRSRVRPRHYLHDLYGAERRGIAGILRDVAPDMVHAHWTYEFELAAQDSGLPHVTTAHDAPFTILKQMRDPYRAARLSVALRARAGIRHLSAVSPYIAHRWHRHMLYRGPISIIPNSIPRSGVSPSRRPSRHPTVLEVADSGRLKNIDGLLKAFVTVRQQTPEAELRLVGPGLGASEPLAKWASDQRMDSGVTFLGPMGRAELAQEYSRAWLFAHASREESFGLTVLEALATGLPVVGGRDSGGVPFVLGDGRAGWLTDVTDAATFAGAMTALIADGPHVPPLGTTSYIEERFSLESVTEKYLALYEGALSGGRTTT